LLDLSRIEAGELAIELQPVSVAAAVHRAVEVLEPAARDKNVTLELDIESGSNVVADEKALDQVILNLLDNAVKYTRDGGQILVRLRPSNDGALRVEVADDGPGVPEQHRARIFERFYRVDAGRSRELGGTGLGLSIVRHLMEAMRGEVGFEPNTPRGSTFWFKLPDAGRRSAVPENP
jgi:two-component system phosphate regulon sensor histidine kinase PhoR